MLFDLRKRSFSATCLRRRYDVRGTPCRAVPLHEPLGKCCRYVGGEQRCKKDDDYDRGTQRRCEDELHDDERGTMSKLMKTSLANSLTDSFQASITYSKVSSHRHPPPWFFLASCLLLLLAVRTSTTTSSASLFSCRLVVPSAPTAHTHENHLYTIRYLYSGVENASLSTLYATYVDVRRCGKQLGKLTFARLDAQKSARTGRTRIFPKSFSFSLSPRFWFHDGTLC